MTACINEFDLLKKEFKPDIFIIDGLLSTGVTLLCGTTKIGKSWLILKLCICVTRGIDFWGRKTLKGKVLYCCLEDPEKRIRKRYEKLVKTAEELNGTEASGWLNFKFDCPKLYKGLVEELEEYVDSNQECKLIVIDTLQMIRPPVSDSPYANDYNNIIPLKSFADKHDIAVAIIHHTRKLKSKDPFEEISGTLGLNGAADTMMILSRKDRNSGSGKLIFTGRDIADDEIELKFVDGCDWRLSDETGEDLDSDITTVSDIFVRNISEFMSNTSRWEGTAEDLLAEAGGASNASWMSRRLNENKNELERLGIVFSLGPGGNNRRKVVLINRNIE